MSKKESISSFKYEISLKIGAVILLFFIAVLYFDLFILFVFITSCLSITYIYILYPVILQIIAMLKVDLINKREIYPSVCLLICVYNEEDVIEEKIKNSLSLEYPQDKLEIIVASDGSTDRTNEIVSLFNDSQFRIVLYSKREGKIGVIIKTVPTITSEIIVFSDANTMIEKGAIKRIVKNFYDPKVGGVSADVVVLNKKTSYGRSESLYYKYERWIQKKESHINSVIGVDGGLYAIRRELYVEPSINTVLDDFVISMNATKKGHRLIYDEKVKAYEESENSYFTEFEKKTRVIAGGFQALLKKEGLPAMDNLFMVFSYISHKLLRWLTPVFLLGLLISSVLLIMNNNVSILLNIFTMLQIIFYLLAGIGLIYKEPINNPLIHIPFYFCLVNMAALYGLYKGIFNKQSAKWKVFKRKQEPIA